MVDKAGNWRRILGVATRRGVDMRDGELQPPPDNGLGVATEHPPPLGGGYKE